MRPRRRRELVQWVQQAYRVSQRRAAGLVPINRSSLRYLPYRDPDTALRRRLRELAGGLLVLGFRRHAPERALGFALRYFLKCDPGCCEGNCRI